MNLPHLLIIDDSTYERILYKEYLGDTEYVYSEMDDGYGIIESIQDNLPDVILLDWQLPKQGGLQTLKILKKSRLYRHIPVIIITGLQDTKVLEDAFENDSFDFINKPASKLELKCRVENAIKIIETNKTLLRQKRDLEKLNEIISNQNNLLQKSIEIQKEVDSRSSKELEIDMNAVERKLIKAKIQNEKYNNLLRSVNSHLSQLCENEIDDTQRKKIASGIQRNIHSFINESSSKQNDKEEVINPDFAKKLIAINPKLTPLNIKLCTYIKLNYDNYEISRVLNVELKSLQMSRYRLKSKLNINKETSLREFLVQL